MAIKLARRLGRGAVRLFANERQTAGAFNRIRRDPAGAQQHGRGAGRLDDGAFDAERSGAAVQNHCNPIAEVGVDVRGCGGADMP